MDQKFQSDTVFIYGLLEPNSWTYRYIGKTKDPEKRLCDHIYEAKNRSVRTHKQNWIFSLLQKGQEPRIDVLIAVNNECADKYERMFIELFKHHGLTNSTDGGEGRSSESMRGEKNPMYGVRLTGDRNPFFGKTHSEKTKQILREKCQHPCKFKGKTDRWSEHKKDAIKLGQKTRKIIYRFDLHDNFIDEWISTRELCRILNFDRRTVQRVLQRQKSYNQINGFKLSYDRTNREQRI